MIKINQKQAKILKLALDPVATEGEWQNAAILLFKSLRSSGATYHDVDLSDASGNLREFQPNQAMLDKVMPFGKFSGTRLRDLDYDYLEWLHSVSLKPRMRAAVDHTMEWHEWRENGPPA